MARASGRSRRRDTPERARMIRSAGIDGTLPFLHLRIPHIGHPLHEKAVHISGVYCSPGERLRVAGPSEPFIALRTVGRHRKEVRAHSPDAVGNKLVYSLVPGDKNAGLVFLGDRHDRKITDRRKRYFAGCRERKIPPSEKRKGRHIRLFPAPGKSILRN